MIHEKSNLKFNKIAKMGLFLEKFAKAPQIKHCRQIECCNGKTHISDQVIWVSNIGNIWVLQKNMCLTFIYCQKLTFFRKRGKKKIDRSTIMTPTWPKDFSRL